MEGASAESVFRQSHLLALQVRVQAEVGGSDSDYRLDGQSEVRLAAIPLASS